MIVEIEHKVWEFIRDLSPAVHEFGWKRRRVIRYIISGGTAAAVNIGLLYFFTSVVGIWYIISSALSFIVAFFVSFVFQKFWTFEDHSTEGVHGQALAYLVVTAANLGLNTILIYCFVEFFHIHYLLAQIIAGILIACESFFVYRMFIFKKAQAD